jgi:ParB-like chromosome segregation protein Spo0J
MESLPISKVRPNSENPRYIKDEKFKKLVKSLRDFPEMANVRPIVVNTEMVVLGGNMRLKAMQEAGWSEVPVQVVDWSEEKQREFIIKDNVGFGEWDWDELANTWDAEELNEWGLDVPNLEEIDKLEDGEEIELPQSVQLEPPMEYILVMAEPNSVEWEELKEILQLRMVRRGGYKKGSEFDAVALERVLNWNDLKERLNANSSTK